MKWKFDLDEASATWRVLGYAEGHPGECAELRFITPTGATSRYVTTEREMLDAVKAEGPGTLVAISVQPRSATRPGKATADVDKVRTLVLDIEPDNRKGVAASAAQRERAQEFVRVHVAEWFKSRHLSDPVVADSGNGVHVFAAVPAIEVAGCPDIAARTKALRNQLASDLEAEAKAAGVRIDSTQDLARVVKLHGTRKPARGHRVSRFLGGTDRVEDPALRDLLLTIDPSLAPPRASTPKSRVGLPKGWKKKPVPERFGKLLREHERLKSAYEGTLDDLKDRTRSGQDMSLVSQLVHLGMVDEESLAVILLSTPHRKAREHSDPRRYVERTIAAAFDSLPPGMAPGSGLEGIVGDPDFLNPAQDFRDDVAFVARQFLRRVEEGGKVRTLVSTKVITSDRRMLDLPATKEGVARIPGTTFHTNKAYAESGRGWSLRERPYSIEPFIRGESPPVPVAAVFSMIEHAFEEFIYFRDRGDYILCALYVVLSYVYRQFDSIPYLHFHGPKGSGKTTCGRLFEALGFNGQMTTSCSAASLFRNIDQSSPLFVLDETESMASRRGSAEDPRSDLLKGGYQRGAVVTRQNPSNIAKTDSFDIYCPKVICNITGLDDVLSDRSIAVYTTSAPEKEARALARSRPDRRRARWRRIRDALYCLVMKDHEEISQTRAAMLDEEIGFSGRDFELWFPLFARTLVPAARRWGHRAGRPESC